MYLCSLQSKEGDESKGEGRKWKGKADEREGRRREEACQVCKWTHTKGIAISLQVYIKNTRQLSILYSSWTMHPKTFYWHRYYSYICCCVWAGFTLYLKVQSEDIQIRQHGIGACKLCCTCHPTPTLSVFLQCHNHRTKTFLISSCTCKSHHCESKLNRVIINISWKGICR